MKWVIVILLFFFMFVVVGVVFGVMYVLSKVIDELVLKSEILFMIESGSNVYCIVKYLCKIGMIDVLFFVVKVWFKFFVGSMFVKFGIYMLCLG